MSIFQHFQIIHRIYFVIGIAPCHLCITDENDKNRVLNRVPVLVSFLCTICVASLQFSYFYLQSFGLIIKIINCAHFSSVLFSNATANLQCWYYKSIYQDIIYRIQRLESLCNYKFSKKMFIKNTKRNYILKAVFIIGFFTISAGIVLAQAWSISSSTKTVLIALLTVLKELMTAITVLHFTLFVDIVRKFLSELNNQIRCSPICFYASSKITFLKRVKLVHMDLFRLVKQINNFFGWNLLLLMVHYFILITYSFYWIFLTLLSNGKSFSIVGEFKEIRFVFK